MLRAVEEALDGHGWICWGGVAPGTERLSILGDEIVASWRCYGFFRSFWTERRCPVAGVTLHQVVEGGHPRLKVYSRGVPFATLTRPRDPLAVEDFLAEMARRRTLAQAAELQAATAIQVPPVPAPTPAPGRPPATRCTHCGAPLARGAERCSHCTVPVG
jgi:hypothetical protein